MAKTPRTSFYSNWAGNVGEPPVWVSIPNPGPVDEFGSLSYDLSDDCTNFRDSNPFELLSVVPANSSYSIVGTTFGGSNLTPGGTYTVTVRAYSSSGDTADVTFTHTVNAATIPAPVWVTTPSPGAVSSGTGLSYDLTQDCTGFRAVNPFELVSVTPAGSNHQIIDTIFGGQGLAPEGSYTCTVRAYNEEGVTADTTFTHVIGAAVVSPDVPVAVAASYVPMSYEFYDDFSNGDINHAAFESYYWTAYAPPEGTIAETGNRAVLTTGGLFGDGNKPYIRSRLDYRCSPHFGPVEFIYENIDLSNSGGAASDRRADFYLTDSGATENGDEFYFAPSAINIRLQDNSGGTRIWVGSKEDSPSSAVTDTLVDQQPGFYVKKIRAIHFGTGFFLEVFGPGGSDYAFYRGTHNLTDPTLWGRRGDAYHSVQTSHTAADPATENTLSVGPITVRSMLLADVITGADALDPGYQANYYAEADDRTSSSVAVVDVGGEDFRRFEAAGIGAARHHGAGTPVSRHHSPFLRPFEGSSIMGYSKTGPGNADSVCARYVGWASDPDLYAAHSCIVAVIRANGAVSVWTKMGAPNSLPTQLGGEFTDASAAGVKLQVAYTNYSLWSINADGTLNSRIADTAHGINPRNWGNPDAGELSDAHCSVVHGVWREADNSDTAQADFSILLERREAPHTTADTVLGPNGDSMPMEIPTIHSAQTLAGGGRIERGIISPARPPFNLDRTGVAGAEECTEARRHANDFCREWAFAAVTPAGATFQIAGQEEHIQSLWLRTTKIDDAPANGNPLPDEADRLSPNYDMPVYVTGGQGDRPIVEIAANTPAFGNASRPQSPVYLWHRGRLGNRDDWDTQANDGMGCTLRDMEYVVRAGNPGANGPSWRGAQAVSIRKVKVTLESGINCFEGMPGSGGEMMDCEAIGGVKGVNANLDIRLYDGTVDSKGADGAQPSPVIAGCIWRDQSECAIAWGSQTALTVVGNEFYLSAGGRAVKTPNPGFATSAERSQFSVIDSYIEHPAQLSTNRTFEASRSVYLENVYVKNPGSQLIEWLSQASANGTTPIATPVATPAPGQVLRIIRFAQGITGPSSSGSQNRNPVVDNGVVIGEDYGWQEGINYEFVDDSSIPTDLRTRWLPRVDIHFEDSNLAWPVITERQRLGLEEFDLNQFAADNNHRIALPKGMFHITQTYEPPATGAFFVSMRPFGRIHNRQQDGAFTSTAPLYLTADSSTGDAVVREVTGWSSNPNTEQFHNRSGNFLLDSPWTEERNYAGWNNSGSPALSKSDRELIKFYGANAGGFICSIDNGRDFSQGDAYRKIMLTQCGQPVRGFGWNVEHTRNGGGSVEIHECTEVIAAGFKAEGCFRLFMLRDNGTGKIKLYGFGGNQAMFPWDQSPNNYRTASPGVAPTDNPYVGTIDPGTASAFSYYTDAGANTPTHLRSAVVGMMGDNQNVLIAQTQLIARTDDANPSWNNVYGLKFNGSRFHVITDENGAGATYLSACSDDTGSEDDRPVLFIKGTPD